MPQIDVGQARRQFDQLLERAFRGEDVLITKDDRPLARITSPSTPEKKRERQFGSVEGEIWMSDDFDEPLDEFREYR
jgi:prevent-host-death family protein